MASPNNVRSVVLAVLAFVLVVAAVYLVDPTFFGLYVRNENFTDGTMASDANYSASAGQNDAPGSSQEKDVKKNPASAGGDEVAPFVGAIGQISGFASKAKDASGNGFQGEGFADMEDVTGPAAFDSAAAPAGCYPRDQLTPGELLPKDPNSVWAQQNPMGTGSLKGKNFLSAGALIGVNTVGQSLRNANYQLRSEPPNPQVPVTVFNNSTIEPDTNRRDFEVS